MKVKDIGQISYLRFKGYEFDTYINEDTNKVIFDFTKITDKEEAKIILKEYWNSQFYQFKLMMDSSRKIITNIKDENGD